MTVAFAKIAGLTQGLKVIHFRKPTLRHGMNVVNMERLGIRRGSATHTPMIISIEHIEAKAYAHPLPLLITQELGRRLDFPHLPHVVQLTEQPREIPDI